MSWLPFYHDMGLFVGIVAPILGGLHSVVYQPRGVPAATSPVDAIAGQSPTRVVGGAELRFRIGGRGRTSDDDMAGLDLGDVLCILSGSERVQPATVRRFTERFARFNLRDSMIRPSYGMAEATVYVATRTPAQPPEIVHFESEKLSAGEAKRCASRQVVHRLSVTACRDRRSCGSSIRRHAPSVQRERSVRSGCTAITSLWAIGADLHETERTFGGKLVAPSAGTPEEPWLRTGDLGFISDGELFIIGRIKDLLIVYGRNHSPDDIEATIQEITRGRVRGDIGARTIARSNSSPSSNSRSAGDSYEEATETLGMVKREVTSAISNSHGLSVADLVLVPPGSIPITTSGKVRRAACVEHYRHGRFARLDV